ncbi:MAG: hypothetical protein AAF518_24965, partial [Spirochaetota bacterium]
LPAKYLQQFKDYFGIGYRFKVISEYNTYKVAKPKPNFFLKQERSKLSKKVMLVSVSLQGS